MYTKEEKSKFWEYIDSYKKEFNEGPSNVCMTFGIYAFNFIRMDKRKYNNYSFVEGSSDEEFYRNINGSPFDNSTYFIRMLSQNEIIDKAQIGKKGVLGCYKYISNAEKGLSTYLDKTCFIVDSDTDGLKTKEYEDFRNFITVTKPYSFENYFVTEDNLKEICICCLNLDNESTNNCINSIKAFLERIDEWNVLWYTYQFCRNNNISTREQKDLIKWKDIFDFKNRKLDAVVNEEKMLESVKQLKYCLNTENAIRQLKANREQISNNSNYVIGHIMFDYLEKYMQEIHSIEIGYKNNFKLYKQIVSCLKVDIDIKNGKGESKYNPINA